MNFKLLLQYDGTDFHGWQIQESLRTVQGELTRVLSLLDGREVVVHGSGRTDAGVHAEGQVASVQLQREITREKLRNAINGNLPPDVRVLFVSPVAEDFHARYSARSKTYTYRIVHGPSMSPFWSRYALLETKIKLRAESENGPSIGFRFGVQLPNSSQGRGIGLNQTNAYGQLLIGKKFGRNGRVNTFGNLGIGILTAPTQLFTQNDVVMYGAATIIRINNQFSIAGEVNGRMNTRPGSGPLGTESQGEARLGMQIRASGLRFDFAGIKGLTSQSPRSGLTVGVTYDTPSIFKPAQ